MDIEKNIKEAVMKYSDTLYKVCIVILCNEQDVQDAIQDTFCRYLEKSPEFRDEEHEKAWLIRVAINRAKDITASFWRKNKVAWEDYMGELAFEEPEDSLLFETVMRLPEKYRTVIHLFYYEDYAVEEIAGILRRPAGTVKSQLSRGKKLLKNMLQEGWDDDE